MLVAVCVVAGRASDLEAPLRESYIDKGIVSNHSLMVDGLLAPVSFLRAGPSEASKLVVLLHGMAFSAETWKFVGILDSLARAGVQAIALDIPGYADQFRSTEVRNSLLKKFLTAYGWRGKLVVVAASAGGLVGAPFVLDAGAERLAGYVSVSALLPSTIKSLSNVPALLVWGALDAPHSFKAKAHEQLFKTHQMVILPDAPHPCYLKEPTWFNELVVQFVTGSAPKRSQAVAREELQISAVWQVGATQFEL